MTDGPDETLRPVPTGRVWIRPVDGGEPWREAGTVDEENLRQVFAGGTAFSGLPRRPHMHMPMSVTLRLEPCLLCRAALAIINGKIKGPASFRLDDGEIIITPHADTCYGEHGRTPGTVAT